MPLSALVTGKIFLSHMERTLMSWSSFRGRGDFFQGEVHQEGLLVRSESEELMTGSEEWAGLI